MAHPNLHREPCFEKLSATALKGWIRCAHLMSLQLDAESIDLIRAYCLQNALQYEGKGQAGSVIGRLMAEREDLRKHGKEVAPLVAELVEMANVKAAEEGLEAVREEIEELAPHLLVKQTKERKSGLSELPDAVEGGVVLRFAPNPNGPLSFGHSRGVVINSEYAKRYDGRMILRFDDTDTVRKPPLPQAYSMIEEEFIWLSGITPEVIIASDRIEIYHQYAEELFHKDGSYVCECSAEEFKQHRVNKTECPHRENPLERNLELWGQMNDGTLAPGDAVVRVKTDMQLANPALRDWPALRIQDTSKNPHPRDEIGSRWRVWPLLDFQSAVEDHLQGVTHIIRGKDLMDSTRKQILLYEHFDWKYPETIYWGRVKVHEFGSFSTSGMRQDIESGEYEGWDDIRLPTIAALRRKGISAEALRSFWLELSLTQKDINAALSTLHSHNTKVIDLKCPRKSAIRNPVKFTLDSKSIAIPTTLNIAAHPEHDDFEKRVFDMSELTVFIEEADLQMAMQKDGLVRLKDLADVRLDGEGRAEILSLEPETGSSIIHWLPTGHETILHTVENGELKKEVVLFENNNHPNGTLLQLERIGYARKEENGLFICHG